MKKYKMKPITKTVITVVLCFCLTFSYKVIPVFGGYYTTTPKPFSGEGQSGFDRGWITIYSYSGDANSIEGRIGGYKYNQSSGYVYFKVYINGSLADYITVSGDLDPTKYQNVFYSGDIQTFRVDYYSSNNITNKGSISGTINEKVLVPDLSDIQRIKYLTNIAATNASNAYSSASQADSNALEAKTAANMAKTSADTAAIHASTAANRAATAVDELQDATHGLVATKSKIDSTYTKAEEAKAQAVSATNAAQNAKVSADSAVAELRSETYGLSATKAKLDTTYTKANTAATQAANAASRVWDSTEGKSAATLAKEARENASSAVTAANNAKASADMAVNQTTYSGQSAAYWAYVASVNAGTDTIAPTIKKVQGQNGATCTTSSSFTVVITASDNGPDSNLRYRAICDGFDSGWSSSNTIALTGLTSGPKTATIRVSDNPTTPDNGNVSHESFTFFKI